MVVDYVIHTFPHVDTIDDGDDDDGMNGSPQDRPPPPAPKELFVINEDIELGDLHGTADSLKNGHVEQYEDDLSGSDDGSTTLLGAGERTRGIERSDALGWRQVSTIVLEVCVRVQHN